MGTIWNDGVKNGTFIPLERQTRINDGIIMIQSLIDGVYRTPNEHRMQLAKQAISRDANQDPRKLEK